jgi:UDP-glucose 4-epimerase
MKSKIPGSTFLVTGGAGFVGSYIVERLLHQNPRKIFIVDNLIRGSYENMKDFINDPVVEFIQDDIRNYSLMDDIIKQCDYIFHLAALRITRCADNPLEAFPVMAEATFRLIEAAKSHSIKKIIYSSSASVYGLATRFPTPETESPYDNKTLYGAAKLFGEQLLRSYADMYQLNYVALRYFNIYGPKMDTEGKYTEVMIKWLDCIRDKKNPLIFGDGLTTMDFVYVDDVARANIHALESDISDTVFNIGCSKETSLAELLDLLLKVNGSDLAPEYREARAINPVSRRLADISRAEKMLGFSPTVDLETGLLRLSQWYFSKIPKQSNTLEL